MPDDEIFEQADADASNGEAQQAAAPAVEDADRVSVNWGEEVFCPVPYQSFRLGPFFMSTKVRPGETPEQALTRAWEHLDAYARSMFIAKRNGFISRLRESGEIS